MMRILVIGLVYHLLLRSQAAGEDMVKVQICKNVFEKAITDSVNEIEESELMDHFTEGRNGKGNGKRKSNDLPVTNVELRVLPGIQILNTDIETTFPIKVYLGDKTFYKMGRRWIQNDYVFLDMDIVTILQLKVKSNKIVYSLQDCEVFVRSRDSNQDGSWFSEMVTAFRDVWRRRANQESSLQTNGKKQEPSKEKVCGVVRKVIRILNENWKDYFVIDPSGDKKLLWKSTDPTNGDCLKLYLNLVVGGSEVFSEQKHGEMPGNGVSLLTDYINTMLLADDYLTQLNKKLEEKNLQLSPEDLQKLLDDVHETDPTGLKLIITEMPQLNSNGENLMMTVKAKLQGYASKSDKAVFDVLFETNVKIHPEINNNKLEFQFLSCGKPYIHDWQSSIGNSGNLDTENLEILIKDLNSGTLLGALNGLGLSFGIPFWNLGQRVEVEANNIEIFPEEK